MTITAVVNDQTSLSVVSAILSRVKDLPTSLLNWDGSCDYEDMLFNLKQYVHRVTGWPLMSVDVERGVLNIREPNGLLLSYDVRTGREIYGRVHHVGLTVTMLGELQSFM